MLFGIEFLANGGDLTKLKLKVARSAPGDVIGSILGPAPQVSMTRKLRGTYHYLLAADRTAYP